VEYATNPENYEPYKRDPQTLSRLHVLPGTPGFEHHVGGLEKDDSGNVSYVPDNHDRMIRLREAKIQKLADVLPQPEIFGAKEGDLLIISWGSTYGTIYTALDEILNRKTNKKIGWIHLRWINPLPKNLADYVSKFKKVLVPEINLGQLIKIIRSEYLVDAKGFNKVRGLPLSTSDLINAIDEELKG
jgi:2-oxoglutarate ferredoxin oxidoreductase subunit alpha